MEVLKLGGSVVTYKDRSMSPNIDAISRLSKEIAQSGPRELIIVHGGGSFGHPVAKEYEIAKGYINSKQKLGFGKTHQAMIELNTIIMRYLFDAGIPAISIAPSSFIVTSGGKIETLDLTLIREYIELGVVPVLYGDAVLDEQQKFTILSGDQLSVRLALELKARKLIFGVDVDGLFSSNPKLTSKARLIPSLNPKQMKGFVEIGEAIYTDVTGGMLGKISEAVSAVEAGISVLLINALKPDVVRKALCGEPVIGTWLTG